MPSISYGELVEQHENYVRIKKENAKLRRQLAELQKVQPCGHRGKFSYCPDEDLGGMVTNSCSLCLLDSAQQEIKRLRGLLRRLLDVSDEDFGADPTQLIELCQLVEEELGIDAQE